MERRVGALTLDMLVVSAQKKRPGPAEARGSVGDPYEIAAFAALSYPGILLVWPPSGHISMFIRRAINRGIKHGISQNA